jgi:hypothetical protein
MEAQIRGDAPLASSCKHSVFGLALVALVAAVMLPLSAQQRQSTVTAHGPELCLDSFCIGQSIADPHFDAVDWIIPEKFYGKKPCGAVGCDPHVAFRGYPQPYQKPLAEAVSWTYAGDYNIVTKNTVELWRHYKYECNPSARGIFGERRFFGIYRSVPSRYYTVIGLRLIDGELRVYRIARQFPYHTQAELSSLAKTLHEQYGSNILLYPYLSSNAYSEVIAQKKNGWFSRSTMFNPTDLADNAAELVLIDPRTRALLQPTSMPESGEIRPLPVTSAPNCSQSMPIQ